MVHLDSGCHPIKLVMASYKTQTVIVIARLLVRIMSLCRAVPELAVLFSQPSRSFNCYELLLAVTKNMSNYEPKYENYITLLLIIIFVPRLTPSAILISDSLPSRMGFPIAISVRGLIVPDAFFSL